MIAPELLDTISQNLAAVRSRVERAADAASRDPSSVTLVAVSKTFPADHVRAAALAGQRDFGENRVQEALPKIDETRGLDLRWHLIGHLQSNKARKSVGPFAAIHSIDSLDLLLRVDAIAGEANLRVRALIQVDLAGEATKFGLTPEELADVLARARECRHVEVTGLMLLPPFFDDPEATRPFFRRLRLIRDELLEAGTPQGQLTHLSMGMSHDFPVAIEEGATMVRVGTAIFGKR